MRKWNVQNINKIHAELSNNCNAVCPFCARSCAGVERQYTKYQVSITQFKEWFPPEFVSKIDSWKLCGSRGDPAMCTDLLEILAYIQENNKTAQIVINTNGGIRNKKFWTELASFFVASNVPNRVVTFSIDGLEDTNHLYRIGVNWTRLMENVESFTSAGGLAQWDMLVFKHNEHQIELARQLSQKLNFHSFEPKRPLGFDAGITRLPVYSRDGNFSHFIGPADDPQYQNVNSMPVGHVTEVPVNNFLSIHYESGWEKRLMDKMGTMTDSEFLSDPEVALNKDRKPACKSLYSFYDGKQPCEIYVGPDGSVAPCCFIGTSMDAPQERITSNQLQYRHREFGLDKFNLGKTPLTNIIDNLNTLYADSWNARPGVHGNQLFCILHCGENSKIDMLYVNHEQHIKPDNV